MRRRDMLASTLGMAAAPVAIGATAAPVKVEGTRAEFAALARRIAEPVLALMAAGQLKQRFALELSPVWDGRNRDVAYLEIVGRLLSGIAPWLALPDDATPEGALRRRLRGLAVTGLAHTVDPERPDYLLWKGEGQALVDSAFLTQAFLRAPDALWSPLDATTKARFIAEIKGLRRVDPPYTNWLLFAAMNEAFLLSIGEDHDPLRLNTAIRKIREWYVGDGWYGDGEAFHFDYYNGYVIQPMLVQVLEIAARHKTPFWKGAPAKMLDEAIRRMQRHAVQLERLIGPDGSFPPIGRSMTYRTAGFQPLAWLIWRDQLPDNLPAGQARAALAAMHGRIFGPASNFTKEGFLTLGFAGHRPELADVYSNNGSTYITTESLLMLGLPADHAFWTAPAQAWTQKKAFAGEVFPRDYAVDY